MRHLSTLLLCSMFLVIAAGACGVSRVSQADADATATARIATSDAMKRSIALAPVQQESYKVVHETGLYASTNHDANQIAILSVGTILLPANGRSTLSCINSTEDGLTLNLCQIEVSGSGKIGWVLRKWIEKN